jgi:hypothetical protein
LGGRRKEPEGIRCRKLRPPARFDVALFFLFLPFLAGSLSLYFSWIFYCYVLSSIGWPLLYKFCYVVNSWMATVWFRCF